MEKVIEGTAQLNGREVIALTIIVGIIGFAVIVGFMGI